MNDSELELRLQKIEQRLGTTESAKAERDAAGHLKMTRGIRETAKLLALRSLVQELAVSAGVSPDRADAAFQRRILYYMDCLHRMAEGRNAGLAAQADDRSLEEIPTEDVFPALFDDPEE
jgi:hypothetical protein